MTDGVVEKLDLYTLLRGYANRTRNPRIHLETFIRFLQTNAGAEGAGGQHLSNWATDTRGKIKRGLEALVRQQKVEMGTEDLLQAQTVFLPFYYAEIVQAAYTNINESADCPLPDERALKVDIPPDQIRAVNVDTNLVNYLRESQTSMLPIIKLTFQNSNPAVALHTHLPFRMLEIAVDKLRDSFRRHGTLDFFSQKLITHFHTQEARIKEFLQALITRPNECITNITEGGDFSFSVWMFLCQLARTYVEEQVERIKDRKPGHVTVVQSATLVLAISNYYKVIAMDSREKELTFLSLNSHLLELPYMHTIKDIYGFKTQKGETIIDVYGEKEINDFFKTQLASSDGDKMPELLKFLLTAGEEYLVKKEKLIPLCHNLVQDAKATVLTEIKNRWLKKLREYRQDVAMKFDDDFEDLLDKLVVMLSPELAVIARDKRTAVVQEELGPYPVDDLVFNNYKPVPWRSIFRLKRETILADCRISLPFWYSIPFLVKLAALAKYGPKALLEAKKPSRSKRGLAGHDGKDSLRTAAEKMSQKILPAGASRETYLEQLNDRWNQFLDKKEREKITRDVNALVKNYMVHVLKIQSRTSITEDMVDDTAQNIIDLNKSLRNINDKNSLRLYIKTYILQLLADSKI